MYCSYLHMGAAYRLAAVHQGWFLPQRHFLIFCLQHLSFNTFLETLSMLHLQMGVGRQKNYFKLTSMGWKCSPIPTWISLGTNIRTKPDNHSGRGLAKEFLGQRWCRTAVSSSLYIYLLPNAIHSFQKCCLTNTSLMRRAKKQHRQRWKRWKSLYSVSPSTLTRKFWLSWLVSLATMPMHKDLIAASMVQFSFKWKC